MSRPTIPTVQEMWPHPILEFKEKGSNSKDLIFLSVGRVCTTWEVIETNLGFIFGQFAESNSSASQRAYGVISNTSGRHDALQMAAEIYHDRHYKFPIEQFKSLMKHYTKAASYRNRIAHGLATEFMKEDNLSLGFFLVPSFFSSKHKIAPTFAFWEKASDSEDEFYVHGNAYRFTHEDIDFLESKFQFLNELLGYFAGDLIASNVERTMRTGREFMHDVRGED
ncbi:MAG: hypothetical protein CTY10_00900 [Methylotenera sp.]|nr:MAG: hypothetical protein CTY10_00900 [Methylotenera sp.]